MLLANRPITRRHRMLGDLPPLTNGLHEPEPMVVSEARTNLGDASTTLPPVSRVLPPLRGAPRLTSSLSQPEGDFPDTTDGGLSVPKESGDLQSVTSAAELQAQRDAEERTSDNHVVVSENSGGCSPLSRLFGRFRKDKPAVREAVTPETPEEPKEEPDDESRPEGQMLRAGLPDSPAAARPDTPAATSELTSAPQTTGAAQSKTCSIL